AALDRNRWPLSVGISGRFHRNAHLIPSILPKGTMQASKYPLFLASLLFEHMRRQLRKAGRENERILPLINVGYNDNAPMLTVGAAIVNDAAASAVSKCLDSRNMTDFLDEKRHLKIGVPPLTLKEKVGLDRLMPRIDPPTSAEIEGLGFKLKPSQIEAYHRFYKHYPTFGELAI
ncbi:MAG: hypothetical protein O3C34_05650, partial [Proteobacteria bacterium]|nr:hypothetical protein [Pseudomonadota bacterium]